MKRPVFLIVGIVLVFILVGIWLYVLIYGNPENISDTFANFNLGNTTVVEEPIPSSPEPAPVVEVNDPERLRQLTTSPTAGFQILEATASTSKKVYYIEAGTGHIFSIDTMTGVETRISRTTIANTSNGVITPDGRFVALQSSINSDTIIGELTENNDTLTTSNLGEQVVDIVASTDNTFLYTTQTASSFVAKQYYPISKTSEILFTVPFREAIVAWGRDANDTHYVYPKASHQLEGAVYKVSNGVLTRTAAAGYGVSAVGNDDYLLYSSNLAQNYRTRGLAIETDTSNNLPIAFLPEKCTSLNALENSFVCGGNISNEKALYPDTWYTGDNTSNDALWEININNGIASLLISPELVTGRQLDIIDIITTINDSEVYFKNKTNNTLWVFERFE